VRLINYSNEELERLSNSENGEKYLVELGKRFAAMGFIESKPTPTIDCDCEECDCKDAVFGERFRIEGIINEKLDSETIVKIMEALKNG
tara:strand:+ start:252 stop:518 length:267 start_codon:yes stop_codon:yes gene_type:complete